MSQLSNRPLVQLEQHDEFIHRHIGPSEAEIQQMLVTVNATSLDDLLSRTVPETILLDGSIDMDSSRSENECLSYLKFIAAKNKVYKSFIGMGYSNTHIPNVILRNVLENPGWYTAYTPYQPEIAQGRLQALLNFQQMTLDLTGLELASASLLDEATAAAEAMALSRRVGKNKSNLYFVDENSHPQTIDVVKNRAGGFGFEIIVAQAEEVAQHDVFGALLQYPDTYGEIKAIRSLIESVQIKKGIVAVAADIMSLVLLKSPGELGADVVLGNAQRFGVPMGYGGPHAAFFATRDKYKRAMPGRIIGVSVDSHGHQALRMAMQTREQHIRREKATSNICTAQVLLANISGFYAVYHGPHGLHTIAERIHRLTDILAAGFQSKGLQLRNTTYFDTITINVGNDHDAIIARANDAKLNLRDIDEHTIGISLDETTGAEDVELLWQVILGDQANNLSVEVLDAKIAAEGSSSIPAECLRDAPILTHPVFNSYHSETEMLRYLKSLEDKDISLNHSMIALGSCTMKLNATAEMIPVTWPEFANIHPFTPLNQVQGYQTLITELENQLKAITGFDAICMQPNSGAQGEYAGLLAIKKYHESCGESHRNVCLIPSSAHGTNPASAQMAGMKVVIVKCDNNGNVDVDDLHSKASELSNDLAALMITYPSTHGVYEEEIGEICNIIHANGGQVYMDGANLNAQVGIALPAAIGADVSHMNLHKTFCIPHGGGGPGMGPIGMKSHLAPFVANHAVINLPGPNSENNAVSAAPWGSSAILPISWAYIKMMGHDGLKKATQLAILNANYLATKLSEHYPVLYTGRNGKVAHECIIDLRPLKESSGISEEDVAKRLIDYGFHAPTMSFPVAGTLMIEPTESESKAEIDRFIEAMLSIRQEIHRVEKGELDKANNPLVNAPHTLDDIVNSQWQRPYSREEAAYPVASVKRNKFWPSVNRVDNVYGDRNLFCACPAVETYQED